MHSNPAEIGERIKAARKAAHLSQTELAQRLDKTMRTVQKYESGEIEPSIAMINAIAKILDISPADLIGYQKPEIQLDSLSDVIAVLYQLNKKAGIRFEIDVQRPPRSEEWSCSLKFKGNDRSAEMNDSLCLILEEFRDEREKLETYWTDQESFDRWIEKELAYYADAKLQDKGSGSPLRFGAHSAAQRTGSADAGENEKGRRGKRRPGVTEGVAYPLSNLIQTLGERKFEIF